MTTGYVKRPRSIQLFSEVSRETLSDYLESQGFSPAVIAWKYFDRAFAPGSERGLVWVQNGAVRGFIGIIPYILAGAGEARRGAWSCDWSLADPGASPGMGIVLLKSAISEWGEVQSFGGNANTRALLPRIATHTDEDAAYAMVRPLRLGYWLDAARRRFSWVPPTMPFDRLLLAGRTPSQRPRILRGVAPQLTPVLDADRARSAPDGAWRPAYDLAHLEWIIGRCPELEAWTILASETDAARAGAVLWCKRGGERGEWRLVLYHDALGSRDAIDVIAAAEQHARSSGGTVLMSVVARNDDARNVAFQSAGFRVGRSRQPLYISTAGEPDQCSVPMTGLSYFDSDFAYLF